MKRFTAILLSLLLLITIASGKIRDDQIKYNFLGGTVLQKPAIEILPEVMLSWIGAGYLTKYTISNTGQSGVFEPPPGWSGYNGMFPIGYGAFNGRTGEFPRGTNQYYVWGAGLWIGARSEHFSTADDKELEIPMEFENMGVIDSVFDENGTFVRLRRVIKNVRVATTAYYSDQGAISRLWQSNQLINGQTDGKDPNLAGKFLFGQKNKNIEEYQEVWAFFLPQEGDVYGAAPGDTVFRLDYQEINQKRRALLKVNSFLDSTLILLNPFRLDQRGNIVGDIVSDEDTYTIFGDFIKERYASVLWVRGYDVKPLGIRVEQRTYSWNIDDYIYFNFKIKNMNDFPLYDVFVGYFMDNDVGFADDDLIGFDRKLNLGYSYDSDLQETGWQTSAGYIGSVFVETPKKYFPPGEIHEGNDGLDNDGDGLTDESDEWPQIGLTGFQTWIRSDLGKSEWFAGDVDNDETDHLKYFELSLQDSFEVFKEPQDVRQLACSGPVSYLGPGEEISVTVAIVAGASLSELKENTRAAVQKYNTGFIGPEPPPSPELSVQPAHNKVYLSWSDDPEEAIDPFTGKKDFEGYRIYRSLSGLQNDWELLAEFDVADDSLENQGVVEYTIGSSNAVGEFVGVLGEGDLDVVNAGGGDYTLYDLFRDGTYTIEFRTIQIESGGIWKDTLGMYVWDVDNRQMIPFNFNAMSDRYGFVVYSGYDSTEMKATGKKTAPVYLSGGLIYFNGAFVRISDGEYQDLDGNGVITDWEKEQQTLSPNPGDVFTVTTFAARDIGEQTGLKYTYVDEDLIDGMTYYYCVTSYDKGEPSLNIPSLESSYYQNIQAVTPQHLPLEYAGVPELSEVVHKGSGNTTGRILRGIRDHRKLTGDQYRVLFFKNDPTDSTELKADYGILLDLSRDPVQMAENFDETSDSAYWEIELTKFPVIPGSVELILSNGSSEYVLADVDSNGLFTGDLADLQYQGFINYGTGLIRLLAGDGETFTGFTTSARYKYSDVFLRLLSDESITGEVKLSSSRTMPRYIYQPENITAGGDTIDHGFIFAAYSPPLSVDSVSWSLTTDVNKVFKYQIDPGKVEPYDYYITFPDEGSHSAWEDYKRNVLNDTTFTQIVPWKVWNLTLGLESRSFDPTSLFDSLVTWKISENSNKIFILHESNRQTHMVTEKAVGINFIAIDIDENIGTIDTLSPPTAEDTLFIFTSRPITPDDYFEFGSTNMFTKVEKIDLSQIRVVPNPYYIRAKWDRDRFTQHIDFRHLPEGTPDNPVHIRVFNVAGNLIVHLKKNGILDNNEVRDEYGTLSWDLRNFEGLKIASGLYIYQVEARINGKVRTYTGKFAVILGP